MSSDYAEFPTELLIQVGNDLKAMSEELSHAEAQLKPLDGEDNIHGDRFDAAVQSFHDKWKKHRSDQQKTLNNLGDSTIDISDSAARHDHFLSEFFKNMEIPKFPGLDKD